MFETKEANFSRAEPGSLPGLNTNNKGDILVESLNEPGRSNGMERIGLGGRGNSLVLCDENENKIGLQGICVS